MILDTLDNKEKYYSLHKNFKEAFEFLEKSLVNSLEIGKHEINGDELFASVQAYETSKDGSWEAHRSYIDIQFIVNGQEVIEWANLEEASDDAVYYADNDFLDCGAVSNGTACKLKKGFFMILWPEDLHKPKCVYDNECAVDKIVVKILL